MKPLKPLQTHGIMVDTWIPPKHPFVQYEPRDEAWGRYAGVGRIESRLAELYDVRDENNELIGYTKKHPVEAMEFSRGGQYLTQVAVSVPMPYLAHDFSKPSPYRRIALDFRMHRFACDGDDYLSWFARLVDGELLVRSRFIECIGQDHINEFAFAIRRRYLDREYDRMGYTVPKGFARVSF
jgi:hypothetical protein